MTLPLLNAVQSARLQAAMLDVLKVPDHPVANDALRLAAFVEIIGLGIHETARVFALAVQIESHMNEGSVSPNHISAEQLASVSGCAVDTCEYALRLHGAWRVGVSNHHIVPEALFA